MPAAWVSAAAAAVGAIGSMSGSSGGSSSSGSGGASAPDHTYVPTNQPGMDAYLQNYYNTYANTLQNTQNVTEPLSGQVLGGQYYNPYASSMMQGVQYGANTLGRQADQGLGASSALNAGAGEAMSNGFNNSGALYAAGNQAYQTGFDPRGDIYNQNRQALTEGIRSGEYARGIQMSPYGASVEADALGKFQNDWQNQQQQRQLAGAQGMQNLYGAGQGQMSQGLSSGISGYEAAGQIGQNAANMYTQAGSIPYQAQNSIYGNQNMALQNYMANQQPYMQGLNQLQSNSLGYMNFGQGAQNQAFDQSQVLRKNAGQNAAGWGNLLSQGVNAWNTMGSNNNPSNQGYWEGGFTGNSSNGYNQPGYGAGNMYTGYDPTISGGWGIE